MLIHYLGSQLLVIACFFLFLNVILIKRKKNCKQKMEFIKKSESKDVDLLETILQFAM